MAASNTSQFVSVTAASKALDVSVDTIRRWSKLGLIKSTRDTNNKRLFNLNEIDRLQRKLAGDDQTEYRVLQVEESYPEASCIDLFAGAGGTALGFHNAGIPHVMLNEIDQFAAATLQANSASHHLNWNIVQGDVREIDFTQYSANVIQAGFPCQAFSYAGKVGGLRIRAGRSFLSLREQFATFSLRLQSARTCADWLSTTVGKPWRRCSKL